ncbi:anthocyanidin 3-O-glucosyltransferase 5-like [Nicotiana tomentosiformis]|uniref:anthocyanidin 3-O-glucosyltransferase 5-like n=1 Tax=Nicotiana tomentosiformis TaxID=4098 RepID=UPI00388CA9B0
MKLFVLVGESLLVVKSAIFAKKHIPEALIVNLFCTEALLVAKEFGLPSYIYVPTTAWYTTLTDEPLKILGCKPVRSEDVVDPMLNRNDYQYSEYIRQWMEFYFSDGILMNTWEDAETGSLKEIRENEKLKAIVKSPVYPVGPLQRHKEKIRDGSNDRNFLLNRGDST